MRSLLLALLALAPFACAAKKAQVAPPPMAVSQGKDYWQVLDESSRERVGFLQKTTYDNGRVLYWVLGPERDEKLGYITPNGSAYQYKWFAGRRSPEPTPLGADTYSAGSRRVLGYNHPVVLEPISIAELMAEREPKQETSATDGDGDSDE